MRHTFPQGHAVAAAREYHTTRAPLHQLGLTADSQSQRQQPAFQALATVNPDQTHTLPHGQIDESYHLRHSDHLK